jgi:uncharacterized metal-binding protein
MLKAKGTITCDSCTKVECRSSYPKGIPAWCIATAYHDALERTKMKYSERDNINIYKAAGRVVTLGCGKWPRVQEAIEFAKELKINIIGLASCVALINELGLVAQLFTGAGFDVVSSACQIGTVSPEDRGVNYDNIDRRHMFCNPIAQAEICNVAGTQLNFILGLCLGHDILFTRHSKAPASVLIVKDRVTGHNPAAVLYASNLRRPLFKIYCDKIC